MINNKKVVGIVSEFNPFHEGHKYIVKEARDKFNADYVVAVMSGDFVQRGEPSIFSKYERTLSALQNGVDLVLMIPGFFSLAAAEDFAGAAVAILKALGSIDHIVFGSESGDIKKLIKISEIEENEAYIRVLHEKLKEGMTYPKASEEAIKTCLLDSDLEGISFLPNDILGIEYLKAMKKQNVDFTPCCIKRDLSLSSAHSIRDAIKEEGDNENKAIFLNDFSKMLSFKLLLDYKNGKRLSDYMDVSKDLENAILSSIRKPLSFEERIEEIKSKNYTYARVKRALLHILLSIEKEKYMAIKNDGYIDHIRVLGFNKNASEIWKNASKKMVFQLGRLGREEEFPFLLRSDIYIADMYNLIYKDERNEFTRQIIKV